MVSLSTAYASYVLYSSIRMPQTNESKHSIFCSCYDDSDGLMPNDRYWESRGGEKISWFTCAMNDDNTSQVLSGKINK